MISLTWRRHGACSVYRAMNKPFIRSALRHTSALACALLTAAAPALARATPPVPAPEFAPYIEVRTITAALPGTAPPGTFLRRTLAADRTGALGGRIVVATSAHGNGPGRIDLVDPKTGVITQVGGPDLLIPQAVATPWSGSAFVDGVYYFQQADFLKEPYAGRRVYVLPPNANTGTGVRFSPDGMDAGTGLVFAPPGFGATFGGQLFGSDSGNAPGASSGDGIRRWDATGAFTNEIMGPLANNPDTYTDVTFTGPEFSAYSNRLVAINTTGTNGENILIWKESTLRGGDALAAYNAREVFARAEGQPPVSRATYGSYGATGYLFTMNQSTVFRNYGPGAKRAAFLTAAPGFNDVEFGSKRTLLVADREGGLYEVRPSPKTFAAWLLSTGCGPAKPLAELVETWQTDERCPGAQLVCNAMNYKCSGSSCLGLAEQRIVTNAIMAICTNPCGSPG